MEKKNKLWIWIVQLSLAYAIGLVSLTLFYLITTYDKCIRPFEPNLYIKIPEIIFGIFSIIILFIFFFINWNKLAKNE